MLQILYFFYEGKMMLKMEWPGRRGRGRPMRRIMDAVKERHAGDRCEERG